MKPCHRFHPEHDATCRFCYLWATSEFHNRHWGGDGTLTPVPMSETPINRIALPCASLGPATGNTKLCPSCRGQVKQKTYACAIHGEIVLKDCIRCKDYVMSDAAAKQREIANGIHKADQPEVEHRLGICRACPLKYFDGRYCRHPNAGGAMEQRAVHKMNRCPEDYWTPKLTWAYGVTTAHNPVFEDRRGRTIAGPSRLGTTLPGTLRSLAAAGFDKPRLFVDGMTPEQWVNSKRETGHQLFELEVTLRSPTMRTYGNWILALAELYVRDPHADRYAIFQDDMVTCKGLRDYLNRALYPDKGYLNLYTFPVNQNLAKGRKGFYESNQRGLGAVALVMNRRAVTTLIINQYMVDRVQDRVRGWRAIDGGIVSAFKRAGFKEYVHNPSLVQHTGKASSMGNNPHATAVSFPGEEFNAMSLFEETHASKTV